MYGFCFCPKWHFHAKLCVMDDIQWGYKMVLKSGVDQWYDIKNFFNSRVLIKLQLQNEKDFFFEKAGVVKFPYKCDFLIVRGEKHRQFFCVMYLDVVGLQKIMFWTQKLPQKILALLGSFHTSPFFLGGGVLFLKNKN